MGLGEGSQSRNGGFLKVDYWQLPIPAVNLPLKTKLMIPAYFPLLDLRKIVSGSLLNCVGQHVCQFVWVYGSGTNVGQSEKIQKKSGYIIAIFHHVCWQRTATGRCWILFLWVPGSQ